MAENAFNRSIGKRKRDIPVCVYPSCRYRLGGWDGSLECAGQFFSDCMGLLFCKSKRFIRLVQPDIAKRAGRLAALICPPIGLIGQHETEEVCLAAADIEDGHA